MTGLVSGLADKASSLLGGGPGAPPKPEVVAATAVFVDSGPLEDQAANSPGATAIAHPNIYDPKLPIQFIHFGHCHQDVNDRFLHDVLNDTKPGVLKDQFGSHAIMFRAALAREAILIDGFIAAAQSIVKEMADSQSPLDSVVGAVGSLMGGSSAKAGPDPAQLDPYKTAVDSAGGSINKAGIQYADIHAAGIQLNQGWYDWDKFAPSMAQASSAAGGGLLGNLPSLMPSMGGAGGALGDAFKTVTGILFKMFDIYEGMYLKVRAKYEPVIRENCYARSMAAIRGRQQPLFEIWGAPPGKPPDAPPPVPQNIIGADPTGEKVIDKPWDSVADPINNTYKDVEKTKQDIQDDWKKFWDTDPPDTPGSAELKAIIAAVSTSADEVIAGFTSVLKINSLPGIVHDLVADVVNTTCAMLGSVYLQIQDPEVAAKLNQQAYFAVGQKHFEDLITNYLTKLANGVLPVQSLGVPGLGAVSSDMATKKAGSFADEKLGKDLDPILALAMGGVSDVLTAAMKAAKKSNSLTMEVYLAQLPLLIALTTRNTFFPIWQLIVDKLFGTAGGVMSAITSPVSKLMDKGRDLAAGVKSKAEDVDSSIHDTGDKAANTVKSNYNKAHDTLNALGMHVDTPVDELVDRANSGVEEEADKLLGRGGPADAAKPASFPGPPRLATGTGVEIKKSEWEAVHAKEEHPTPNKP